MFVKENHRGKHIGKRLFAFCLGKASETDCRFFDFIVLKWNQKARDMYDKFGAKERDQGAWALMRMNNEDIARFQKNHIA